jgi:hypothetical protein
MNKQQHLLIQISEECNEVGQRISKALRFGLDEVQPQQDLTNHQRIQDEIDDLVSVILMAGFTLPTDGAIQRKVEKVKKYLRYAASVGTLA